MKNNIGFWKVADPYGEFSNWYLSKFTLKGVSFISSEQALMYLKAIMFKDEELASKILEETNQRVIKDLGRQVKNYDDKVWSNNRWNVMVNILKAKFSQNERLKELLLNTGEVDIYEASPCDNIWGIGSIDTCNIKGENLLGKALMETREWLRKGEIYE